jgi:hypothetical protein
MLPIGEPSAGPPIVPIAEAGNPLPSDEAPVPLPTVPIADEPPRTVVAPLAAPVPAPPPAA